MARVLLKSVSFGTNLDLFGTIATHLAPSNDLSNHVLGAKIGSRCFSEFARLVTQPEY